MTSDQQTARHGEDPEPFANAQDEPREGAEAISKAQSWFRNRGFTTLQLEAMDQVLVVKLPSDQQARLLAEEALRAELVCEGKALGFQRVALDLSE